ncbi:MAG TPA: LuxR C-terminal-related transcriptional regulator, partial [Ktedonobacteraceae bacterium]|nr:LuxR C-terminal-related transcriptional regulator [Ktedonobacteraceae bacterium]
MPEPLSERELEALQLLAHGASNREIAQELRIVIGTVK